MIGLYTPPDYTPPTEQTEEWQWAERRSKHPVDVLSRSLNQLCLEASDRYEIIAHLEALGYNSPSKLEKLGETDHFTLGTKLFERTPKRFVEKPRARVRKGDNVTPIVMLLSLAATIVMSSVDMGLSLIPAVIILIWSQLGSALLSRAKGELDVSGQQQVLSALMAIGAVALLASWVIMDYGLETANPPLLWFAVAGLLWSDRKREALLLPLIALLTYGAVHLFGIPSKLVLVSVASLAVCLAASTFIFPSVKSLKWLTGKVGIGSFFLMYGLGQGLLLIALLGDAPSQPQILFGTLLLATTIASSSVLLTTLLNRLMKGLWSEVETDAFANRARTAMLQYIFVYCIPLVVGVGVSYAFGNQDWLYHWFAFALFGMVLAIAVTFFTLGQHVVPSVAFLVAGLVVMFTSASFPVVAAVLAGVQTVLLMWWTERVERYAIYLI